MAMRRRRRYEVVVEGLSGQAASHRSVVSDHRSEAEARETASLERARLEVIYGDGANAWRVLVVRDDEVLAEETPYPAGERRQRAAERAPRSRPRPEAETPVGPVAATTGQAPGEEEPVAAVEAARADPAAPSPLRDEGPIPAWLIARFEESIERQRERTYGASAADDESDPPPA